MDQSVYYILFIVLPLLQIISTQDDAERNGSVHLTAHHPGSDLAKDMDRCGDHTSPRDTNEMPGCTTASRDVLQDATRATLNAPRSVSGSSNVDIKTKGRHWTHHHHRPRLGHQAGQLSFIALGDWGARTRTQARVASTMAQWASENRAQFVLSLGDHFYPCGVNSTTDRKWRTVWKQPFLRHIPLRIPWVSVLGNHDCCGISFAQVQYTSLNRHWHMPDYYYSFVSRANNVSVKFIQLDTNTLMHSQEQWRWLQAELRDTTDPFDWKIVSAHHPVFTAGVHARSQPPRWLRQRLRPLLERHRVDLYISGHDHDLQHLYFKDVHYVVSGGGKGSRWRPAAVARNQHSLYRRGIRSELYSATAGFVGVLLRGRRTIRIEFVRHRGDVLHSVEITK